MLRKKILVVDNDVSTVSLITDSLGPVGYRVISAPTGPAGLQAAVAEAPSLILINLASPETKGLNICKTFMETEGIKDIPIILLTLREGKFDPRYTEQYGLVDFIKKPVNPHELVEKVSHFAPISEDDNEIEDAQMFAAAAPIFTTRSVEASSGEVLAGEVLAEEVTEEAEIAEEEVMADEAVAEEVLAEEVSEEAELAEVLEPTLASIDEGIEPLTPLDDPSLVAEAVPLEAQEAEAVEALEVQEDIEGTGSLDLEAKDEDTPEAGEASAGEAEPSWEIPESEAASLDLIRGDEDAGSDGPAEIIDINPSALDDIPALDVAAEEDGSSSPKDELDDVLMYEPSDKTGADDIFDSSVRTDVEGLSAKAPDHPFEDPDDNPFRPDKPDWPSTEEETIPQDAGDDDEDRIFGPEDDTPPGEGPGHDFKTPGGAAEEGATDIDDFPPGSDEVPKEFETPLVHDEDEDDLEYTTGLERKSRFRRKKPASFVMSLLVVLVIVASAGGLYMYFFSGGDTTAPVATTVESASPDEPVDQIFKPEGEPERMTDASMPVETIKEDLPARPKPKLKPKMSGGVKVAGKHVTYHVQFGAFRSRANAENMVTKLGNAGYETFVHSKQSPEGPMHMVLLTDKFSTRWNAFKQAMQIKEQSKISTAVYSE